MLKVALLKLITVYNADFLITINELSSLGKNLFVNPRLIVYFYRIETKYSNYAIS